jgi:hypothetical protein
MNIEMPFEKRRELVLQEARGGDCRCLPFVVQ